ncbi:hypothetical protein BDP27DRAFT_1334310 [Rhodocollybia butyracea]|uniref:EF-hand domain-containing protein n=1 Tax=Rhodocollybia butyracea TaxID=206335 RepID=A0A9P5U1S9_9AGAR|nr:hypothetical protein BDP27DRAFT_1334310 [Rhodocollybia butyracea]
MSKYANHLTPNLPSTHKLSKSQKSRARREPSGVFSLFQAPQIQQFKEAFQLIDHDKDGWVNESDLREIFTSLGITPTQTMLDDLLSSRPGDTSSVSASDKGINFTIFDENDNGTVKVDDMRRWLGELADRMSEQEIDKFLKGPFTDRQGNFNYREWIKVLRVNEDGNEAETQTQ